MPRTPSPVASRRASTSRRALTASRRRCSRSTVKPRYRYATLPTMSVVSVAGGAVAPSTVEASREERVYRVILEALASGPMTIGRLAKTVGVESDELRGYRSWMRQKGKIVSTGRARATRYALA